MDDICHLFRRYLARVIVYPDLITYCRAVSVRYSQLPHQKGSVYVTKVVVNLNIDIYSPFAGKTGASESRDLRNPKHDL